MTRPGIEPWSPEQLANTLTPRPLYVNYLYSTLLLEGIIVYSELHTVALLRSLSGKYPWERYEPPYPPSYGLNSTTTVLLEEWLWY